jgi:hypothetical protein
MPFLMFFTNILIAFGVNSLYSQSLGYIFTHYEGRIVKLISDAKKC